MLYAVLQGLPSSFLDYLDRPWVVFCERIERAMKAGHDPLAALRSALAHIGDWERETMKKALIEVQPVMQMPGLSFRQKEALIALRYAGAASLSQLSRVLVQDRSNTHKRLTALVKKGLAIKFFRPDGVYYFAIPAPMERSIKTGVNQMFNSLLDDSVSFTQP